MPKDMNEESFTVLRDATPPELSQRRQGRVGAGKGCFAGLCKCLSQQEEDYGSNKAQPHVIAQVGVNAIALSSPKPAHGVNGGTNGSGLGDTKTQDSQGLSSARPLASEARQAPPSLHEETGLASSSQGIRTDNSVLMGESNLLEGSRSSVANGATVKALPQVPDSPQKPREPPPQNLIASDSDTRTTGAHLFGTSGAATPRVTHLQSASAAASGSTGPPRHEEYVEQDEKPLSPARSIRNVLDQNRYDEQDEDSYARQLEAGLVLNAAGEWVLARPIEQLVVQEVEAVQHCMLISHETSDEMGCLLTLRAAPRSAGVALDHAGLQLASKSGSEAATVMSARQCALFRRGLALELEYLNHQIVHFKVQIRRSVLRHSFLVV